MSRDGIYFYFAGEMGGNFAAYPLWEAFAKTAPNIDKNI